MWSVLTIEYNLCCYQLKHWTNAAINKSIKYLSKSNDRDERCFIGAGHQMIKKLFERRITEEQQVC